MIKYNKNITFKIKLKKNVIYQYKFQTSNRVNQYDILTINQ